jgi:ubiquitin-protein ligase E3 C
MFFDEGKMKKMNLGDKKVTTKGDFLKKIKDEKSKEQERNKISESNKIISKFFKKSLTKSKIYPTRSFNELTKNLNTLLVFLNSKKELDLAQKEKIALAGLQKTLKEISSVYNSLNISNSSLNDFTKIILEILKYFGTENLRNFVIQNFQIFTKMILSSLINFYVFLKKDYLIDDKISFFTIYQFFLTNNIEELLDPIYSILSKNISRLYILNYIVKNSHKIITENSRALLLRFILGASNKVIETRLGYRLKLKKSQDVNFSPLKYSNKIVESFIEASIITYLDHHELVSKSYRLIDLFLFYTSTIDSNFLIYMNESKLIHMLTDISLSLEKSVYRQNHIKYFSQCEIDFFNHLFPILTNKINNSGNKVNIDKKIILKSVNDILDLVMESPEKTKMMSNFINLIFSSGKLIETLYHTSYEKTDFHSIIDYIINKLGMKYSENSKLMDEIILYSVEIVKESKKGLIPCSEEILEIISFAILNKIDFKENYFFVEFKTTNNINDIYQNLPFNFMYLNLISKLLITVFTNLISKTNLDDIEKLNQNLIIKCLKSLYMLDADIEFTFNREAFWTNLELISKFSGYSQIKQLESMKIMPFVFPFNYRLTVLYNHFKNLKRNQLINMNLHYEEEEQGYETNLTISRDHMFDETLNLYLNNKLRPFIRWRITFVDKFGNREEGVDAGGLYKEFLFKLSETAFSHNGGLFIESNSGFLMPNPNSEKVSPIHLQIFEFLGFIIGVGLVDDIKLWPNFSLFFLNNILDIENPFTELKSYDPELYKNLVLLKNYEGDVENDYGLNFTLNEEKNGKTVTIELIPNGKNINVTNSNKLLYINKVAQYKLTLQIKEQCLAFRRGLLKVCDDDVLKVFTADELRQLIYGFDKETIDVADMKMNTEYGKKFIILFILIFRS